MTPGDIKDLSIKELQGLTPDDPAAQACPTCPWRTAYADGTPKKNFINWLDSPAAYISHLDSEHLGKLTPRYRIQEGYWTERPASGVHSLRISATYRQGHRLYTQLDAQSLAGVART